MQLSIFQVWIIVHNSSIHPFYNVFIHCWFYKLIYWSIYSIICPFYSALFIRLRTSGAIVRFIGDILQEHIPNLTPHIRWCSCQLNACTLLQSKSTDPQFKEFEQVCLKDPRTGGLPLSSFLLKPMQRVTKYPLLIGKVWRNRWMDRWMDKWMDGQMDK